VLEGVPAGEDRRVGGAGLRDLHDGILDEHALAGQAVEGRRLGGAVPVRAHPIGAQRVDGHEEDVGRPGGDGKSQEKEAEHRTDYRGSTPLLKKRNGPGVAPGAADADDETI